MEVVNAAPNCDAKASEQFDHYVTQMAGNSIQLMCTEYDADSDKCERVLQLQFDQDNVKVPASLLKAFGNLITVNA